MLRRKEQGFTLIELMIVVAIIGILAAIAIPNFLQYQLKSKTTEAKTNLQGIKTGMVALQGERGCTVGFVAQPAGAGVAGGPLVTWVPALNLPPSTTPLLCAPPPAVATFIVAPAASATGMDDIGFRPTGAVRYSYGVSVLAAGVDSRPQVGLGCPFAAVAMVPPAAPGVGAGASLPWLAWATGDLDGQAPAPVGYMNSDTSNVMECNPGQF